MAFTDIVKKAATKAGVTQAQAKLLVSALFEQMGESLVAGDSVRVPDFGNFSQKKVAAREGRNPRTGATLKIAAKTKIRFSTSKSLVETLNPVKKAKAAPAKAAPAKAAPVKAAPVKAAAVKTPVKKAAKK